MPEVTTSHGDRPIYLRLTSGEESAMAKIYQPANSSFSPIEVYIPAYSTQTIDLTPYINQLENIQANVVKDYGLKIEATNYVSAYYEVVRSNNPDIFSLKGQNSLGKRFYIPAQTIWRNKPAGAYNSFDIVATEDNTQITITPSQNIVGHTANTPFTITLHKGQTYSARAVSQSGYAHLAGSKVVSNKDIAITIKDDSVKPDWGGCYDLMGDQLVPVKMLGTEYIVNKGFLGDNDRIVITAIEDNTGIYLNGNTSPIITLQEGESYSFNNFLSEAMFIQSSNPIYVLHISGFGCELGYAVVPTITCTGSERVSFTRSRNVFFGIMLVVKAGHEDNFILNGSNYYVQGEAFNYVPGTNQEWMAAKIDLTSHVSTAVASTIYNQTDKFHIGIINGDASGGCRYGYFSNFSTLNIGSSYSICIGDDQILDAGPNQDSYLWNTGDTTQQIEVSDAGLYYVTAQCGDCILQDSVEVEYYPPPDLFIGNDTTVCEGESVTFDAGRDNYTSYLWQNGSQNQKFTTTRAGLYWAEVTNFCGMSDRDTVEMSLYPLPETEIPDTSICFGQTVTFDAGEYQSYLWQNGHTAQTLTTNIPGTYWVKATDHNGCEKTDYGSLAINGLPPLNLGNDTSICQGETLRLDAGDDYQYLWQDSSTQQHFDVTQAGKYFVRITDHNGCTRSDTIRVAIDPLPQIDSISVFAGCFDTKNAKIQVFGSEGTQPYSYILADTLLQDTAVFDSLAHGFYSVELRDTMNCSAFQEVEIVEPPLIQIQTSAENSSCFEYNNGFFEISAQGGTGTLLFSADSAQSFSDQTLYQNLSPDTFFVAVQDYNGCITHAPPLIISQPDLLEIDQIQITPVTGCYGDRTGEISLSAVGGNGNYRFSIDSAQHFYQTNRFGALTADTFFVAVTDQNYCPSPIDTAIVNQPDSLRIVDYEIFHINSCFGNKEGMIEIFADGGTGSVSYSINGFNFFENQNKFDILPAGYYPVVIHDQNNCTTYGDTIHITQPQRLTIFSQNAIDVTGCYGGRNGEIHISASGGSGELDFSIDGGENFEPNGGDFEGLIAGEYPVVVRDTNFCTQNGDTLRIEQPEQVVLLDCEYTHVQGCYGDSTGSITVSSQGGTGNLQYSIDGGQTYHQNNGEFTNLPAGTYIIAISDQNACSVGSDVILTQPEKVEITDYTFAHVSTCFGDSTGSITLNAGGGTGELRYSVDAGENLFENQGFFTGLPADTFYLWVEDQNACPAQGDTLVLSQPDGIEILTTSHTNIETCFGENQGAIEISAQGGEGQLTYTIESSGESFENTQGEFQNLYAGLYLVHVTDENGCVRHAEPIAILQPERLKIDNYTVTNTDCFNDSSGVIQIWASGGSGTISYAITDQMWFEDNGGFFPRLPAGNYRIAVSDAHNCITLGDSVQVAQPAPLTFLSQVATDISCQGAEDGQISLTTEGGTGTVVYQLTGDTTLTSNNGMFENLPAGQYSSLAEDVNNCTASGKILLINEPEKLRVDTIVASSTSCFGNTDGQIKTSAAGGNGEFIYFLNDSIQSYDGNFTNLPAGWYAVRVIDAKYCTENTEIEVWNSQEPCIGGIPSAFTPNGDGVNDTWMLELSGMYPNAEVRIFNSRGQELVRYRPAQSHWDGKMNGKPLPLDTYWYSIDLNNGQRPITGFVTIVK